ncbi:MAG: (d)CMP kinase [Rickettsiales bacterium]|nr:(d)CMP kinase [Rickettsiales bacterium]MCA0254760.1 (d)CMP kinase [Pseudomonadota bacterium]
MNLLEIISNKKLPFILAMDGPAASGKGHIGYLLAKEFDMELFHSGLVYRSIAYICTKNGILPEGVKKILDGLSEAEISDIIKRRDLNIEEIGSFASKISSIYEVREFVNKYLKTIIKNAHRIIMEGRDIGTVIAPNAQLKIFITAAVEVRAERRYKQLLSEGKKCILGDVLDQLIARDNRDSSRKIAPNIPASDAVIVDTTHLTPQEVIKKINTIMLEK